MGGYCGLQVGSKRIPPRRIRDKKAGGTEYMGFRKDFWWDAATSSYQIEGAAYEDGKGLNIWDVFCQEEGRVFSGHTGMLPVTITTDIGKTWS